MKVFQSALFLMLVSAAALPASGGSGRGVSADNAWNLLRDGNERFARGLQAHPHSNKERRNAVIESQHPFAVVLGCADSRVPVERVMDAGIGDLFTIRVAGNASAGDMVIGSIEYGVIHAGAKLVAVIGHESCGAVKAALAGHKEPGTQITSLVSHILPAADNARDRLHDLKGHDMLAEAVERNVLISMQDLLLESPQIAERVRSGQIKVVGGVYSLHTGRISWLGEHPSQTEILESKPKAGVKKK